ncbi:hypothetical protein [Lysobacter sp. A3-1-A15]|uniref:hypothetical protein n=1 Tax=Novilysobacter viscosus TaxID=3098602 RepID=UPI002EDAD867
MRRKKANKLTQVARSLGVLDARHALRKIGDIRAELQAPAYVSLLRAVDISAPKHKAIFNQKPTSFADLAFRGPMQPLRLENELAWAASVLPRLRKTLDDHSELQIQLQSTFAVGDFEHMAVLIDRHIEVCGWSYWAADLKFAVTQKTGGTLEVRRLAALLQKGATNRPSSLYATILIDRTDETLTYGQFSAKAGRSFPRFEPLWFRTYIRYRATGSVDNPEHEFPILLSTEIKSSAVDYFECIIDCLITINEDSKLSHLWGDGRALLEALSDSALSDLRIVKLRSAYGITTSHPTLNAPRSPTDRLEAATLGIRIDSHDTDSSQSESEIINRLIRVQESDIPSSDESDELIKTGLNFKSLPLGVNVAYAAFRGATADVNRRVLDLTATLVSTNVYSVHCLAFRDDIVIEHIDHYCEDSGLDAEDRRILSWTKSVIDNGYKAGEDPPKSLFVAWLAKYLVTLRRFEEAYSLCVSMDTLGAPWTKLSAKLKIRIAKESYDLNSALRHAAEMLVKDYRYAYDLPLDLIFSSQSWSDFKKFDPALIGLVAHYATNLSSDGNTRFICRMACRYFFKAGSRESLDELWSSLESDFERAVVVAFLEDAWTEENLVLIEDFRSTHDVRRERMELFQQLLIWNPEGEQEYSRYIKQLTLDETLWRGLQHLDETRIFVNEAAISRWAEKELLPSFERWRSLNEEVDPATLDDELIRNYLVNPSVENLIMALPQEGVTESNTILLDIIDRMFKRFMTDPANGLESYLSLRIRHGTLRGTLLGPIEEEGLLISGDASEEAFHRRWDHVLPLQGDALAAVLASLRRFSLDVQESVRALVDERVQVHSSAKPVGTFPTVIDSPTARLIPTVFSPEMSFSAFLSTCYMLFWTMIQPARQALADHISVSVKSELQSSFERLSSELGEDSKLVALVGALRAAATNVQNQCDIVSGWFTRESESEAQSYPLHVAIEIAKRATNNVYRKFDGELVVDEGNAVDLNLSANGLAVLYDCLYVVFENAWKHSGLGEALGPISVSTSFCKEKGILELNIENRLSLARADDMRGERLAELRAKYLRALPVELVAREGGSGFAKLARAVQMVDRELCPQPLDFGVREGNWYVKIDIPLYERNSRYDAYE